MEELPNRWIVFSSSGQWNFCESFIGNAGVTLRAQKIQLHRNEAVKENAAMKKIEVQAKALDKAQTGLAKYEVDQGSLTDKDWGDIVCWVLPEAKQGDVSIEGAQEERSNCCEARNLTKFVDHVHSS